MKSQSVSALILSSLLALSATALAACQPEVGVGADPETAVKGNATPAASPAKADPEAKKAPKPAQPEWPARS